MKTMIVTYMLVIVTFAQLQYIDFHSEKPKHDVYVAELNNSATWQQTYSSLLTDYIEANNRIYFAIFDIDKDDILELIIAGTHMDGDFVAVYTYKNNQLNKLEHSKDVLNFSTIVHLRGGVRAAPSNEPGFVSYTIGPSAGIFPPNIYYERIIIDGNTLKRDAYGKKEIDIEVLNAMFGEFGGNYEGDDSMLHSAIEAHSYFFINDIEVTNEELVHIFGDENNEELDFRIVTEANIKDAFRNPQ